MSEKKFPMVYFKICSYCKHLVVGLHRDGYNEGCGLVKNKEGKFAHIAYPHDVERLKNLGMDVFNFEIGCENFKPNGMPAHPSVHLKLASKNPKFKEVPVKSNINLNSWDFCEKVLDYLPKLSRVDYSIIQ
jgi:hypothetical protein